MKSNVNIKGILTNISFVALLIFMLSCWKDKGNSDLETVNSYGLIAMERFDELNAIGMVIPRRSEEIQDSRWGLQYYRRDPSTLNDIDSMLERMAESGVHYPQEFCKYGIRKDKYSKQIFKQHIIIDFKIDNNMIKT